MTTSASKLRKIQRDIEVLEVEKRKASRFLEYTPRQMTEVTKRFLKDNPDIKRRIDSIRYAPDRKRALDKIKPTRESLMRDEINSIQQRINRLAASAQALKKPATSRSTIQRAQPTTVTGFIEPKRFTASASVVNIPGVDNNGKVLTEKVTKTKIRNPNKNIYVAGDKSAKQINFSAYRSKMNEKLPKDYPYFVQSKFNVYTVRAPEGKEALTKSTEVRYEPRVTVVRDDKTRSNYIDNLIDRVFTYNFVSEPTPMLRGYVQDIDFKIYRDNGAQKLIKVSKYYMGNCLVNIIKDHPKVNDIFEKLPHLIPTEDIKNPEISEEDITVISRVLKAHFTIYSKLGSKTYQPWRTFGTKGKGRQYHIVFSNGHATMMERKIKIDSIVYGPLDDPESFTDVVDSGYEPATSSDCPIPLYYVRYTNGKFIMYKTFRPSSFTLNPDDDKDINLAYTTNKIQVASRLFKKEYLNPVPSSIKDIVKAAEHFIPRRLFTKPTDKTKLIDANKCFVSYKTNPFYTGFPTNDLYPTINDHPDARFSVVSIKNVPKAFQMLTMYKDGDITLPTPVVRYLQTICDVEVRYSLIGNSQDIDVVEFADKYKNVLDESEIKRFRNNIIGYSIAGGMQETKKLRCAYSTQQELDQLVHECGNNKFTFSIDETCNVVTVDYKNITNGAFHFHSYILGYALIHMSTMLSHLLDLNLEIVGYNVDAILYNNPHKKQISYSQDAIGGWKVESIQDKHDQLKSKTYYFDYPLSTDIPRTYTGIDIKMPNRPLGNILITGAAGVSKSYPYVADPHFDQVLLTFTKRLMKRHTQTANDLGNKNPKIFTAAKYFQFGTTERPTKDKNWYAMRACGIAPARHKVIVVDEFTMFSKFQWDIMIRRAQADGSFIITLGDPEQISNNIEGSSVNIDYFRNRNFTIIDKPRLQEEEQYHRHNFADGSILDSLRGGSDMYKLDVMTTHCKTQSLKDIQFTNSMFITDNHKMANMVNKLAKEYFAKNNLPFPVKNRKGEIRYKQADDKKIWWDKIKMCAASDFPKEFSYEPAYAVTADSVQGETTDKTVYVDTSMKRQGAFYTAVTRTYTDRANSISALDKVILISEPENNKEDECHDYEYEEDDGISALEDECGDDCE